MHSKKSAEMVIINGDALLGIEFGSTRIKAVLASSDHDLLAVSGYSWENKFVDNVWTYDLDEVMIGLRHVYSEMTKKVEKTYGVKIKKLAGIGISGMMHGYLAFDKDDELLLPFRTWRNTMTGQAAEELSDLFDFNIPQRWTIAHLYQAILNGEPHLPQIRFLTTLSGYVHWRLTGQRVLGIGDASGMFPIGADGDYDRSMLEKYAKLISDKQYNWTLPDILPQIKYAGEEAGRLTADGARLLDASGLLEAGTPLCPPEGDAATGMVVTNAVAPRTGNVSAGTSIFTMIVLEKSLSTRHPEIDIVSTPEGSPVAMVHCNNGTTDLNNWVALFLDFVKQAGLKFDNDAMYELFFNAALRGEKDAGGITTYGYYSGEHITRFEAGRPLLIRTSESKFDFANLARSILFSAFATLKIGMEILEGEQVQIDRILGHGGLYKSGDSGQRFTAAALRTAVSVMSTASEGGAWGIGLLAAYMVYKDADETLSDYLANRVFHKLSGTRIDPDQEDVEGFDAFMARYKAGLKVERAAVDHL